MFQITINFPFGACRGKLVVINFMMTTAQRRSVHRAAAIAAVVVGLLFVL